LMMCCEPHGQMIQSSSNGIRFWDSCLIRQISLPKITEQKLNVNYISSLKPRDVLVISMSRFIYGIAIFCLHISAGSDSCYLASSEET
jgi:hypothetical protein